LRLRDLRLRERRLRAALASRSWHRKAADGGHRRPPGPARLAPLDPVHARCARSLPAVRLPGGPVSGAADGDPGPALLHGRLQSVAIEVNGLKTTSWMALPAPALLSTAVRAGTIEPLTGAPFDLAKENTSV